MRKASRKEKGGAPRGKPSVSIVVPTYNERENIAVLLPALERAFSAYDYEILVVDDGSPDGTRDEVRKRARRDPRIRLVERERKEGVGAALREGYGKARKDVILSTDADFPFPPARLLDILGRIEGGCDLAVANRYGRHGSYEKGSLKTWAKYVLSSLGNKVFTLGLPVHDLTINFRGITRRAWRSLRIVEDGNAMLAETIIKAHRQGFRIEDVEMHMKDRTRGESKLSIASEAPKFAVKILRYRLFR